MNEPVDLPPRLLDAIRAGECVAFVGAGFSAAVVPGWAALLRGLAAEAPDDVRRHCEALLEGADLTAFDYEAAAQILRSGLGDERFLAALRQRLAAPTMGAPMQARRRALQGIPFRAILTTNFDGLLEGETPGREAYLQVLRPRGHRWWDRRFWDQGRPGARVVKLHGDLLPQPPAGLVLSRRDYRERLYGNPAYRTFLRSVFATSTVLYLGFSFTDAYLNELRSEILALLEHHGADDPIAYALINDVSPERARYFREHEGVEIVSYDTGGGNDYSGFDSWLEALHDATSPVRRLGRLLGGRRILWVDAEPRNNDHGMRFLREAAGVTPKGCTIETVPDPETALARLTGGESWDLVITHWGEGRARSADGATGAVAERLLLDLRGRDLRIPVLVFSTERSADERKRRVLGLGGLAYVFAWSTLFQEIERVFAPGRETG